MTTTQALAPPQRLTRDDMAQLATTEYVRTLEQLRLLAPADWARPTDCSEWDVRALVAHLVGTVESSTLREQFRVALAGTRAARRRHRPQVDGMNSIHVAGRARASPAELMDRLEKNGAAFVRFRQRLPAPLRRVKVATPIPKRRLSLGELVDVVYTRDVWIHCVDVATAAGRTMVLNDDHDGRIVADIVAEWADVHQQPFTLELEGPERGSFVAGNGGERLRLPAVEFCRIVSGRARGVGLLATPVLF
jgi:uncharacterized protein (TIGR03083 family)